MRPPRLDVPTLFLAGTAGSGKTTLTAALDHHIAQQGLTSVILNLDPGAGELPYVPDIDIRGAVELGQVMEEHQLGPNGAQIAAADLVALHVDDILLELEDRPADIILVDTPGQLELFAFRASGPVLTQGLSDRSIVAFLLDPVVARSPRGFASQIMLAATVLFRLGVPLINVMSKADAVDEEVKDLVAQWGSDPETLLDAFMEGETDMASQLYEGMTRALVDLWGFAPMVPVSSIEGEGMDLLVQEVFKASGVDL